jgi:ketosteroid isomerase-like protein
VNDVSLEIVRRSYEAFNRRDWDAWRELMDPDVEYVDHLPAPDADGAIHGRQALEQYVSKWTTQLDEFTAHVVEQVAVGPEWVVSLVTWSGRGKGSDVATEWHGAELSRVDGGRIVRGETGYRSRKSALAAARRQSGAQQ